MSKALWSVVLQLSRLGGNVIFFLAMARLLPVADLGAFATALAVFRWSQVLHKGGIADAVVLTAPADAARLAALFWLAQALTVGIAVLALGLIGLAYLGVGALQDMQAQIATLLLVPLFQGASAVQEAQLRQALRLRALALRTAAVQLLSGAGGFALYAMGGGVWSLVGFAVINAVASALLSWRMARWWPSDGPRLVQMRALAPEVMAIAGRGLVAGAALPLIQFLLGLVYGGAIAGGFQIAQRIFQLVDALTLAPLRFLVLPVMMRAKDRSAGLVVRVLRLAALVSAPAYMAVAVWALPVLNALLGASAAGLAAPMVQALAALGPVATTVLGVDQALVVRKGAGRAFLRAGLGLGLSAGCVVLMVPVSAQAMILGHVLASYLALGLFLPRMLRLIGLEVRALLWAVGLPYLLCAGLAACLALPFGAVAFGGGCGGVALCWWRMVRQVGRA
ncbi:oligosaccharide flippase family protein [Thioclava sp. GXIMD4216]|uniref:oligosaccharide flippase family protein n=1 Tax=Thioclava sp. GXIMD4216 TaxID=3131929 RepID=UPI0030D569D7